MTDDEYRSASVLGSPKTQAVHISPVWNTLGTDKKNSGLRISGTWSRCWENFSYCFLQRSSWRSFSIEWRYRARWTNHKPSSPQKGQACCEVPVAPKQCLCRTSLLLSQLIFLSRQLISSLLKPMEEHTEDAKVEEQVAKLPVGRISHHDSDFLKK